PFELTVPGGRVPAAGVSVVGVLPTHRRRGILAALMRAQLDACHERGEPVTYLWATEDTIYGRFGYGIGSFAGEIDLPRERSAYYARFEPSGQARIVPLEEAEPLVAPVYDRVAAETPGMFARTSAWWQARALADPEWRRRGGGDLQCVVLVLGSRPVAYALVHAGWLRGRGGRRRILPLERGPLARQGQRRRANDERGGAALRCDRARLRLPRRLHLGPAGAGAACRRNALRRDRARRHPLPDRAPPLVPRDFLSDATEFSLLTPETTAMFLGASLGECTVTPLDPRASP